MGKSKYYQYFVEGEDEEKLINVLKTDLQLIVPGKVQVFNVVEQKLTKLRLMSLKEDTTVILIFDIDTGKVETLLYNINLLQREKSVKEIVCIPQVRNLEDELKRSCNIRQIKELTNSKSNSDYKRDMIKDASFMKKLISKEFDINKLWTQNPQNEYKDIINASNKIKKKR